MPVPSRVAPVRGPLDRAEKARAVSLDDDVSLFQARVVPLRAVFVAAIRGKAAGCCGSVKGRTLLEDEEGGRGRAASEAAVEEAPCGEARRSAEAELAGEVVFASRRISRKDCSSSCCAAERARTTLGEGLEAGLVRTSDSCEARTAFGRLRAATLAASGVPEDPSLRLLLRGSSCVAGRFRTLCGL